jgi:hypothetical protein
LAEILSTVLNNEKKAGETWGVYEDYRSGVLGNLAAPLLVSFSRLDSVNPQVFVQTVSNIVKFKAQLKAPAWRSGDESGDDVARLTNMLKGLGESHRAATADRLLNDMLEEKYPFRQSSLARGLKLVVGDDAMELQQQAVSRLLATLDRAMDAGAALAVSGALRDYASVLSREQGRHAVERVLRVAENEKNYQGLGLLARALGILAPWLQENEAQHICTRLVEGAAVQPADGSFLVQEGLKGLPGLASRLPADQLHSFTTALVTDVIKDATNPPAPVTARFMAPCLKELAGLLGPDQVRSVGQTLVDAIEREKDVRRLDVWCELVPAVADRLDAQQRRKICARLVEASDQPSQRAALKAWLDPAVLNKIALRLIDSAAREMAADYQLRTGEALAVLIDRLPAESAQSAVLKAVDIFLESKRWDELITHIAELPPLDGIIPEAPFQRLAERVARRIELSASEVDLYAT